MTSPVADRASLARRLDRYRATTHGGAGAPLEATRQVELPHAPIDRGVLAERLARTVGGEVVAVAGGLVVRCTTEPREIPLDRVSLAALPGQPPPGVPLVCLDTETTGLATATGTVAFLVGLGWWEGERFHQVQLLLPDHADEPALLTALAAYIPLDGWLVTYNGRGFDWPLLVTRYRMARRAAPLHGGHLDLLPVVRRLFRHRLEDARLRTVESGLLGMVRHGDIDGSEIPGRYLGFLRGGPAEPLAAVVRHNDQDVRSLARLLVLLASGYGTPEARRTAPAGDLGGLARAYARAGTAERGPRVLRRRLRSGAAGQRRRPARSSCGHRTRGAARRNRPARSRGGRRASLPTSGARHGRTSGPRRRSGRRAFATPWTTDRIAVERAHLLRRLRRWDDAADAWASLAAGPGRTAIVAAIELAKLREHRLRDPLGALRATGDGLALAERRTRAGSSRAAPGGRSARPCRRLRRRLVGRTATSARAADQRQTRVGGLP